MFYVRLLRSTDAHWVCVLCGNTDNRLVFALGWGPDAYFVCTFHEKHIHV